MDEKNVAIRMVINGEVKDISFEDLTLSNNLSQEALVRLLIEKKLITPEDLLKMIETVKNERYRQPDEKK